MRITSYRERAKAIEYSRGWLHRECKRHDRVCDCLLCQLLAILDDAVCHADKVLEHDDTVGDFI